MLAAVCGSVFVHRGIVCPLSTSARTCMRHVAGNLPIDFSLGEVFADGLRNEVGLAFDSHGVLWGVENGADNLVRDDIGGDIHNDNPAVGVLSK